MHISNKNVPSFISTFIPNVENEIEITNICSFINDTILLLFSDENNCVKNGPTIITKAYF